MITRFFLTAFMILIPLEINAAELRNIFSYSYYDYNKIGISKVFENTSIIKTSRNTSFLFRGYRDERSSWHNTIVTGGPVINVGKHNYMELTFGYGSDSRESIARYYSVEFTREMPRYIAAIGYKRSDYAIVNDVCSEGSCIVRSAVDYFDYNTISPSLKYFITRDFSLMGKLFGSLDSDKNFDRAYWLNVEYRFIPKVALALGTTGGSRLYSTEYEAQLGKKAGMDFKSIVTQLAFDDQEKLGVKFLFENLVRESKYTDKKYSVILDLRL